MSGDWSTAETTAQITVQAPAVGSTFTATFATQYQLTVTASPSTLGSVSGGGFYDAGSVAVVQATAQATYALNSFSGDLSGSTNPQNLTMNGPKNVVANFGLPFSPCDVNQDGKTDATDVQVLISEALGVVTAAHDLNLIRMGRSTYSTFKLGLTLPWGGTCTAQ